MTAGTGTTATKDELDYYATPTAITALPAASPLLDGLPTDARGLCLVSRTLIVHEIIAKAYGVKGVDDRLGETQLRSVAEIVAAITRLDPRPLAQGRPLSRRLVGQCQQYATLACALLRRAGIPARARAGYADYFDDTWTEHWVVERWDAAQSRWLRSDVELDEQFSQQFDFDQLDLPEGRFITAAEAWRRCRSGEDDPARYGHRHIRGLWYVQNSVIRDLAALTKTELLSQDVWGLMAPEGEVDAERAAIADELADLVPGADLGTLIELSGRDGLRVPDKVYDIRFHYEAGVPR